MRFNLIAAVCRNRGIGQKGKLPWSVPEDLKAFASITKGDGSNAIVMGRTTWEGLPRCPLPGRDNLVLSTDPSFEPGKGARVFSSIDALQSHCEDRAYTTVWVIGGASVYKAFLDQDLIDVCCITHIDNDYEVDTYLPPLPPDKWDLRCVKSIDAVCGTSIQLRQMVRIGNAIEPPDLQVWDS